MAAGCAVVPFRHHASSPSRQLQRSSCKVERRRERPRGARGWRRSEARAIFTGIVQGKAEIVSREYFSSSSSSSSAWVAASGSDFVSFKIRFPEGAVDNVAIGASVAVNGTCLTVTEIAPSPTGTLLSFDVIGETLRRTTLASLEPGDYANYERSARLGDEVGGHVVSGHVCATASLSSLVRVGVSPEGEAREEEEGGVLQSSGGGGNVRMEFAFDPEDALRWGKYVMEKGYIAINGCSLTVGEVGGGGEWFSVYLIPETLRVTVLGSLEEGARVNIEVESQTQTIVDAVERYLSEKA